VNHILQAKQRERERENGFAYKCTTHSSENVCNSKTLHVLVVLVVVDDDDFTTASRSKK
jgi:hypothetical protein